MSEFVFSPKGYASLIGALRTKGYVPRGFSEADPAARHLVVRHDVDFSLEDAATMAEQERRLGLRSTYFVLLRSEFYNPFSAKGLFSLQRIAECGHEIGLHFDAALYANDASGIEAAVDKECRLLEFILARSVTVISFHRPTPERIGGSDKICGRINSYGPRFVREMGYCSDSRGGWYHGEPLAHPAVRDGRALQLLIHPFWWQEPIMPPVERLKTFVKRREKFIDMELTQQCKVHTATSG